MTGKQEEYRTCMAKGLKGKTGLSKEERQQLFCVQSRLCSSKAKTKEEAERLCRLPKPPREVKEPSGQKRGRGPTCEKKAERLAHCVAGNIDTDLAHSISGMELAIANALRVCQCQGGK